MGPPGEHHLGVPVKWDPVNGGSHLARERDHLPDPRVGSDWGPVVRDHLRGAFAGRAEMQDHADPFALWDSGRVASYRRCHIRLGSRKVPE